MKRSIIAGTALAGILATGCAASSTSSVPTLKSVADEHGIGINNVWARPAELGAKAIAAGMSDFNGPVLIATFSTTSERDKFVQTEITLHEKVLWKDKLDAGFTTPIASLGA